MTITYPVTPLPVYGAPYEPISNITPFTYRDGLTYLEVLEGLRCYIRDIIVPFVDSEFAALGAEFVTQVNTMIDTVNAALAAQSTGVNADIAALTTLVNGVAAAANASATAAATSATAAATSATATATSATNAANSATAAAASASGVPTLNAINDIPLVGAGIDATGATDSRAAIQAILDANPGRRFRLPAGVFLLAAGLTLSKGQTLRGSGQQDWRDRANLFGDPVYNTNANYNGTVLRYSGAAGAAITIIDATVNTGGLEDFTLIGPGSGASTGIVLGSATMSLVNGKINRVKVANFPTGVSTQNVNECSFYDLMVRGCTTGVNLGLNTINNAFYTLDIEQCGSGVIIAATSQANSFYSHISQSCTGIGVQISGQLNAFYNPYFENNVTRNVHIYSGARGNVIDAPMIGVSGDSIKIDTGALYNSIIAHSTNPGAVITNAGTATYVQGAMGSGQLVDTGTNTVLIDGATAGSAFGTSNPIAAPTLGGITIGNGSVTAKYNRVGHRLFTEIKILIGSTTSITGVITVATLIPINTTNIPADSIIVQASSGKVYSGLAFVSSAGLVSVGVMSLTTYQLVAMTSTVPFTFAAGDFITISYAADAV